MQYLYVKQDGKTKRYKDDIETRVVKVLQNKNYQVLSLIPKEFKTNDVDFISGDFATTIDYLNRGRDYDNEPKKNNKSLYDSCMKKLLTSIFNLKTRKGIIDLTDKDSFANLLCDFYKSVYEETTAEKYIKNIIETNNSSTDENTLLMIYGKVIKQIVRRYVSDCVDNLTPTQLNAIYENPTEDVILSILKFDGNDLSGIEDLCLRDFITVFCSYMVRDKKLQCLVQSSLCSQCPVDILDCPRVMDGDRIYKYPFIIAGEERTREKISIYLTTLRGDKRKISQEEAKKYSEDQLEIETYKKSTSYKVFKCRKRYKKLKEIEDRIHNRS